MKRKKNTFFENHIHTKKIEIGDSHFGSLQLLQLLLWSVELSLSKNNSQQL